MDRLLTRKEAAELFRVDVRTVSEWVRKGMIESVRIGRKILIPSSAVQVKEAVK